MGGINSEIVRDYLTANTPSYYTCDFLDGMFR